MQRISLISQKGGSGKSTLSVHLAAEAEARGRRVLLVDLDPQGNAASWGARRGPGALVVTAESVAAIDRVLAHAEADGFDLVLFDTAPHADQAALRAARAADVILIPCLPSQFDIESVRLTLDLCALARKHGRVVLNAAPVPRRVAGEPAEAPASPSRLVERARAAIASGGATVARVVIGHRMALRHCMPGGQVAAEIEPGGKASAEVAALYDEMMQCLHGVMTTTDHHYGEALAR